jgi:ketohexokinase/beta-glucosidase
MIWGCFSGLAGLSPLIVWDKDWGNINSQTYCDHTLPVIEGWLKKYPGHILMQDNASMHYTRFT